jgi:uncharacterized surface protein with fasciclin (FAS1) repeats
MMNRRTFGGVALAAAAGPLLVACAPREPQQPTIREVIDSNPSLSNLARLLANAGVVSLDDAGPFTVFAPRNSAFEALPDEALDVTEMLLPENRETLTRLMQLHVVRGQYLASDLVNKTTTLTTESGLSIIVDGFNGINVGGVNVVQPDVMARNGVIHVLDGIIQP